MSEDSHLLCLVSVYVTVVLPESHGHEYTVDGDGADDEHAEQRGHVC